MDAGGRLQQINDSTPQLATLDVSVKLDFG
jgi:hypothetical protein